jgi:hypothetical protein
MSRYIDADETYDVLSEYYHQRTEIQHQALKEALDRVPTVDAVPVVHGKWVFSENDDMFYCTNCRDGSVRNDYPYCHWCGAKMDLEKVTE